MEYYEDDVVTGTLPSGDNFIGILMDREDEDYCDDSAHDDIYPIRFYLPEKEAEDELHCPGSTSYDTDDLWIRNMNKDLFTLDESIFFDRTFEIGDKVFVKEHPRFFQDKEELEDSFFGSEQVIDEIFDNSPYYRRPYYKVEGCYRTICEYDLDKERTLSLQRQKYSGVLSQLHLPNL